MGNGNAKFAPNGYGDGKKYSGWDRPIQTNGGAQHQKSRRYSTTSEESIDDDQVALPSPLSSRRASPFRTSDLAPLSRESTALSLGQRIVIHAAQQEPPAPSPAHGPPSARILPQEPNAFGFSNNSHKRLQAERELSPRAPLISEADGGFLNVESSREAPMMTDSEAKSSYWVPDRGSEKLFNYGQEIGNFHSEEKPRSRRGVSFALHDEILQERSSTFVLPPLKRTDSQSVGNGAPLTGEESSRLPVIGISRRENRPQSSSAKKIQVGRTASDAAISNQQRHFPQAQLARNNSALQKATAVPPSVTIRSTNSQWPTDDDSTSGIGSSTGSITSHTTRYPRSFVRPRHSTSLPSLNSKDTATVPWSDSELLLQRPSLRIIPPAKATSVEANFYHIYHHGIPKKRKKWVLRP